MSSLPPLPMPPEKPDSPKTPNWPLLINLVVLLLGAVMTGFDMAALSGVIAGLVLVNGIAGILLLLTGHRIPYALAFFGSALLISLIGFGVCGWKVPGTT